MADLRLWIDGHAMGVFAVLLVCGAIGVSIAWRTRAPLDTDRPIPMLRKRTASGVLAAAAALFAVLAWLMLSEGWLVAMDLHVTATIRAAFGTAALQSLAAITYLGDDVLLIVLAVAVTLWLLVARHRLLAGWWVFTLLGNGLLIRLLKDAFQRSRPLHEHGLVLETGYSFPSGHAAGSLVFYGMLAYVLLVLLPARWHRRVVWAAISMVVVIGSSRILLQVHYLSDVFAGYALGLGWLALCIGVSEFIRTARRAA